VFSQNIIKNEDNNTKKILHNPTIRHNRLRSGMSFALFFCPFFQRGDEKTVEYRGFYARLNPF